MGLKFSNFPYVTRNGGRAAILVPLTLEKVPVTKNLNKNPDQPKFKVRNAVNTGEMLVARLQPAVKKTPQGTQLE